MSSYIGKDFIHYGCGMELSPDVIMEKVSHSARKNIKKANKAGIVVKRVDGTAEELQSLREIWYYYDDPNFPTKQSDEYIVYMAFLKEELIGGTILVPVGSHLFLNNLMANNTGKKHQLQGYLLWKIAEDLENSEYKYIDVGVSYRLNLYRFFKKWATFNYPVIFNVPEIRPHIDLKPFKYFENLTKNKIDEHQVSSFFGNRPYTIVPDTYYANKILLKERNNLRRTIEEFSSEIEADDKPFKILNLTDILPIPFGAAIVGLSVSPKTLWNTYSCYDHYKEEYIKKYITKYNLTINQVNDDRKRVYKYYEDRFSTEDIDVDMPTKFIDYFSFRKDDSTALSRKYTDFGVAHIWADGYVKLPCHQNILEEDVEYIYAIYRGHLNLCSEWVPTHVKGELK